jgi:DNA polymerase-3 subunit gamma/tau
MEEYRQRLQPGDLLRMLRLMGEDETNIRRSVNPRLAVETLLLRWAMMDRTVDLEEVIKAGQQGGATGQGRKLGIQPDTATGMQPRRPAAPPAGAPLLPSPAPQPAAPPPTARLAPSIEAIRAGWPAIVVAARVQSRFLGELLSSVEPAELTLPWLHVVLREPNPLFAERLEQEGPKVEEILSRSLGQPVRLRVLPPAGETGAPPRPRRISDASIKADRLREFRAKDPTLDTAADALDLEIVD